MGIGHRGLAPGPSACLVPRVHAGQRWSADEVGGHRPQQERAGPGPGGGRGGRDDDAGAGSSLDQAGDLLVVVAADPGHEFAFTTYVKGRESTRWRYHFESSGAGTTVTEAYEFVWATWFVRLGDLFMPRQRILQR